MRQFEVTAGGARYFLEFSYPDLRNVIELDGLEKRTSRREVERELARQNALLLAGWRVLRFTWGDIGERPDWIIECVLRARAA